MTQDKKLKTREDILLAYQDGQRDFSGWNLQGANLQKANLNGADLSHANLTNADLTGAKLEFANLWQTKLDGVKGFNPDKKK